MATSYNIHGYGYSQGLKLSDQQTNSFGGSLGKSLAGTGTSPGGAAAGVNAVGRPVTPSGITPGGTSQSVDKAKVKRYYEGSLAFPSDLGKYYIMFKFISYSRDSLNETPKDGDKVTICLPIPNNLVDNTGVSINETNLGLAGAAESLVMPALEALSSGPQTPESYAAAGAQVAQNMTNLVSKEGAVYGALQAAKAIRTFVDSPSELAELNFGQVPNPYQALLFKGVNLKQHSFSFKLAPRTESESMIIKNIIKKFKNSMLPAKSPNGYLFGYPDVCEISFGSNVNSLYKINRSFLESMSVNYAPTGTPAFFKNSGEPVQVDLTLNFRELSPVTRDKDEK